MKKLLFIFLFLNCSSLIIVAQVQPIPQVQQKWVARYNGPGNGIDAAKVVLVDGSGNVYVAGQSTGIGSNVDYALIKYNSSGVQQWVQRFNGTANGRDYITAMVFDGSGNIIVTGASQGPGSTGRNMDVVTIKYNPAGVQQWIHTFNGFNGWDDIPITMVLDASGNIIIGGSTVETYDDLMTIKYSSSGALLWARAFDGDFLGFDHGSGATVDPSGNVYTAGFVETASEAWDIVTVKYNAAGVQQWVRGYTGSSHLDDCATGILADGSGNVIMSGYACEPVIGYDYLSIKYNSSGDVVWSQRYNNSADFPTSMKFDQSGNLIITGSSQTGFNAISDYATVKYNSSGVQQWSAIYGTPSVNDVPWSITSDAAGNVYVTGESGTFSLRDYATIKYSATGVQQWVQKYNGPGNSTDIANSVAVDQQGNIYVTGESAGSGSGSDYATIKYSQSPRAFSIEPSLENKLLENNPNPFNPVTVISYQLAVSNNVILKIYDILGNEVATLVNGIQKAGNHSVKWDAGNFSSGIYFYKLVTDGFVETKMMNLVK